MLKYMHAQIHAHAIDSELDSDVSRSAAHGTRCPRKFRLRFSVQELVSFGGERLEHGSEGHELGSCAGADDASYY